jgi:putative transposase
LAKVDLATPKPSDDEWKAAQRVAAELETVLTGTGPKRRLVEKAATELRLSVRQVYYLLEKYRPTRTVTSVVPDRHRQRSKRLTKPVEKIIEETLRERWLILEAPPLQPVVAEIAARCEEVGETAPSYMTVQARIPLLFSDEEIAKKRSANAAKLRRLKARPGYIRAPAPLAVCQIDHTPTDINFVEIVDDHGTFIGRANLSVQTDVYSSCILGFCLTLEAPSALSDALCLAHSMCPKDEWLRERNLDPAGMPAFGRPVVIVVDGGKDFRSVAFRRGCEEYGIRIRRRNRGRVHEGGLVERLLGKVNQRLRRHPGQTGRSVADRDGYPAEGRACLTFGELEDMVAWAVIDHNTSENKKTQHIPIERWKEAAGELVRHNDDETQVLLTFLPGPREGRALTPQGISLFALDYYSPWLGPWVPQRDRIGKLDVRYDPRDISRIYVREPGTQTFRSVQRRDGVVSPTTKWEHEAHRGAQRTRNHRSHVQKVGALRQMDAIADNAQQRRKSDLRQAVRKRHAAAASKPFDGMEPPQPTAPPAAPTPGRRKMEVEDWP